MNEDGAEIHIFLARVLSKLYPVSNRKAFKQLQSTLLTSMYLFIRNIFIYVKV